MHCVVLHSSDAVSRDTVQMLSNLKQPRITDMQTVMYAIWHLSAINWIHLFFVCAQLLSLCTTLQWCQNVATHRSRPQTVPIICLSLFAGLLSLYCGLLHSIDLQSCQYLHLVLGFETCQESQPPRVPYTWDPHPGIFASDKICVSVFFCAQLCFYALRPIAFQWCQ